MPNSQTTTQNVEVLGQRVSTLERSVGDISRQLDTMSSRMASSIETLNVNINTLVSGLRSDFDTKVSTLNDRVTTSKSPQWQVIIGAIALVCGLSGSLWVAGIQPIKDSLAEIKDDNRQERRDIRADVDSLKETRVSKADWNEARTERKEAITQLNNKIDAVTTAIVPRGEHQEKWQGADRARADMQRQIDEMKAAAGSTYGVRDVIQRLENQVEELRAERARALRSAGG